MKKNKRNTKRLDAHAPNREEIINLLEKAGEPLKKRTIAAKFNLLEADALEILRRRLRAMIRDGQLVKNRRGAFGLPQKMDLIAGIVSAHSDGYGFVRCEDGGDDAYLSPKQMRRLMHGDRVLISIINIDKRGRREGMVAEILERARELVVGRFVEESGAAWVVPDNPKIHQDILIPIEAANLAKPGQVVVAKINRYPTGNHAAVGEIIEVIGRSGAPGMATQIAIRSFGLPHEFSSEVMAEAAAFGDTVAVDLIEGRRDLRQQPLVTIDGADARDFDDAVYAEALAEGGFKLFVAIADVASYVTPGSALDDEAQRRGTSVYFPTQVVPMLPETLSNGLCSLRPDEDRLALVCEMRVSSAGRVKHADFYAAVIRSHARLTYQQVWDYIDGASTTTSAWPESVYASITDLYRLYQAFRQQRTERGAIDFDSTEVNFTFTADGSVADIVPYTRNDAHKIIEECMIAANVQAAKFLKKKRIPGPSRNHLPPPEEKLANLRTFLQMQGFQVPWRDKPTPSDFAGLLPQIREREDAALIMAVLLRSQSLAVYGEEHAGHFGLALEHYAHFTSPIRRYPDLLVHRAIHHVLQHGSAAGYRYTQRDISQLSDLASARERNADEAERDVNDRLKCAYMESRIGEEFDAIVSGVTSFGLFVELNGIQVSGLVHVTSLPNDYYHFDVHNHRLTGERRGLKFQLADAVKVKLLQVNLDDRKIDFALVWE